MNFFNKPNEQKTETYRKLYDLLVATYVQQFSKQRNVKIAQNERTKTNQINITLIELISALQYNVNFENQFVGPVKSE